MLTPNYQDKYPYSNQESSVYSSLNYSIPSVPGTLDRRIRGIETCFDTKIREQIKYQSYFSNRLKSIETSYKERINTANRTLFECLFIYFKGDEECNKEFNRQIDEAKRVYEVQKIIIKNEYDAELLFIEEKFQNCLKSRTYPLAALGSGSIQQDVQA